MKGFIELTVVREHERNGKKFLVELFPVRINVNGIEFYSGHRVVALSGKEWFVKETFQEITKLIDEAQKEE